MNIVTHKLLRQIENRRLKDFVSHWDKLEALIIRIYRTNFASSEDNKAYQRLNGWLSKHYPQWKAAFRPHWKEVQIDGELIHADPFMDILLVEQADDFAGDWGVMRKLPAAREALNNLLLSVIEGPASK